MTLFFLERKRLKSFKAMLKKSSFDTSFLISKSRRALCVAILKWVHGGKMKMRRQSLNQWVMPGIFALQRLDILRKRFGAIRPACSASMPRSSKRDVLVQGAYDAKLAMVVIGPGDDTVMDLADQFFVNRPVVRDIGYPKVGLLCGMSLAL